MNRVARGAWWYALGLILLFGLAAIATYTVIYSVDRLISEQDYEAARQISMIGTWLLTMGFMFLAAGLGMWAIQYAAARESLRRLGSFIDAMDYLHDGLVALNKKGQIVNANPAASSMAPEAETSGTQMLDAFPCLTTDDLRMLTDTTTPHEIERDIIGEKSLQTLRFRSQPSPDLALILISDVTDYKAQESFRREAARLQLIGRISRGVADDFNRILSIISGQTGLLARWIGDREDAQQSAAEIYRAVQTGTNLASHLIDLSRADVMDSMSDYLDGHLRHAAELLRLALPDGWTVTDDIARQLPPVSFSGTQIEQAVVNLGLICCDALPQPGTVKISAHVPGSDHLDTVNPRFAMIILISAAYTENETLLAIPSQNPVFRSIQDEAGAVLTIVRSGIEEAGGQLDFFQDQQGLQVYRIAVPKARRIEAPEDSQPLQESTSTQLSGISLLLAVAAERGDKLERIARTLNIRTVRVSDTINLLANIEAGAFHAVVLDHRLLEPEAPVMLRAITKLRPGLPIVLLGRIRQTTRFKDQPPEVRLVPGTASANSIFEAVATALSTR